MVDFNAQVVSYASRFNRSQLDGVQKRLFDKIIWRNLEKGKMDRLAEIDTEMGLIYSTHKVIHGVNDNFEDEKSECQ